MQIRSALVIKQPTVTGVLVLLIALLLSGCASPTEESISSQSSSGSAATVPGEKMSDEERYAPGPMGSSNVKW
jgi:PBP1b-binding outer membrane lipoprotein LpoB